MNESPLFQFVNHWWNLPYLVMLGLVAAFFVLQFLGALGSDHGVEPGADPEVDVDTDVDADVDADTDVDADHDVDADGDHAADADHALTTSGAHIGWHEALSFFGVGRVPMMVVWVTFFIFAGFTGIFVNSTVFVNHGGQFPSWGFAASSLASVGVGLVAVRLFSRVAARFVDVGGRGATRKHELSGKRGVVASLQVDHQFGEIRVRDARGNELLLHGRVHRDEAVLVRGEKVVLVDYDPERELFWVSRSPEEAEEGQRQ